MSVLLSHPTGNQNSRNAAQALAEAGLLSGFVTSLHVPTNAWPWRVLPGDLRQQLARRDFSGLDSPVHAAAPGRELVRMLAGRLGLRALAAHETGWASVDRLYAAVDASAAARVAQNEAVTGVYAYEDGALQSFAAAKARGLPRLYELPIGYWRAHQRLCAEEAELQPAWAHTWSPGRDSEAKRARKDAELALATRVIVPSPFVADTLREYPGILPPVTVLPYGCPPPISASARACYRGGPLKLLFVGGLSQRKGLAYLLQTAKAMGNKIELTLIGTGEGAPLIGQHGRVLGSVPHQEVLRQMREHHVLVFPSLFEGWGLVISEAMSQGLPVITTPNTAAPTLIEHGVNGWIVPIRDSAAIVEILDAIISTPSLLESAGRAARVKAASWQWADYRQALVQLVSEEVT